MLSRLKFLPSSRWFPRPDVFQQQLPLITIFAIDPGLCCGVLAGGIWLVGLKTLVGEYTCVNGIAGQFISCSTAAKR